MMQGSSPEYGDDKGYCDGGGRGFWFRMRSSED